MNKVSQLARWQLGAFVALAILSVIFVGGRYARLDNLMGFGQYSVFVDMPSSGGIFTNAEVTYRGVPVGRVGGLELAADGRTVLDSQSDQSSAIRSFNADLDELAAQLRSGDPDIRRLIGTGTAASNQVGAPVQGSGADLTAVLADPTAPQPWDDNPKQASDALNLNPIASKLATVMGVAPLW